MRLCGWFWGSGCSKSGHRSSRLGTNASMDVRERTARSGPSWLSWSIMLSPGLFLVRRSAITNGSISAVGGWCLSVRDEDAETVRTGCGTDPVVTTARELGIACLNMLDVNPEAARAFGGADPVATAARPSGMACLSVLDVDPETVRVFSGADPVAAAASPSGRARCRGIQAQVGQS
ncbi:hypothetical protein GE09DRAFT_695416 [Coniochaeta sp. 2T2.1]|nr:hypothetical protein GE09DRAFT_695416 [Coniochaeta sp. 2T2.1]